MARTPAEARAAAEELGGPVVGRMFEPESGERATMIEGDEEEIAARLIEVFKEAGAL